MSRGLLLTTFLAVFPPTDAWTHANLVIRRAGENIKVDTAGGGTPCGAAPGAVPWSYRVQPGARVTVRVVETIHHPSRYFVSLSSVPNPTSDASLVGVKILRAVETDVNGKSIELSVVPSTLTRPGRTQDAVVGDGRDEHTKDGSYRQSSTVTLDVTVEIPTDVTCSPTCALQFIQQMEENPQSPTYYKSCTDIAIAMDGAAEVTPQGAREATSLVTPLASPVGCH